MSQQGSGKTGHRESDDWRTAAGILSGEDNYYRLLDVPMTASRREITRAYRTIMMKWHPDRVRPEQKAHAEDLAKRLNLAYTTLADPVRRQQYDQSIRNEALQAEIMGRYVGGFAPGGAVASAPRRPMTERERREQRQSDRRANIAILSFFAAIALAVIVMLVIASFLSFAGSALF